VAVVMALGAAMNRLEPRTLASLRTVLFAGALDLMVVGSSRVLVVAGMPALLAPAALAGVVFALTVSPLFAALNSVAIAAAVALAAGPDFAVPFALAAGAVAGAHAAARARRRSELLRAGVIAGIVQFFVTVGVKLATGVEDMPILLEQGGFGLLNGFLCGLVALGLLHIAELGFGVTTDISLLELSDQNHPALRKLLMEAPGTYHHSLIVGNLSETAALAIGANALLARVASYYHDLGKADRPEYFTENEPLGRSRHEGLSPAMSTLIIISHVRDGMSLEVEYRLPRAIQDITAQHHGTSLVEFFYRTAVERAEGEPVDAQRFRYAGPRPQTKEAGIVLLADSVEAASRSLSDPTSARLRKLVHDLTMKRLLDGQFDDSGLTLSDLRTVEDSFVKVLMSMFHTRVPYPTAPQSGRGAGLSGASR
jgi:putative nucleotidyltransferase with HDIG domain